MYDTLRNTLSVEMCQQIDQMEILKQERSIVSNSLVLLWVLNWTSIGSRIERLLGVLESRGGLVVGNHDCYWSTTATVCLLQKGG